MLEEIKQSTFHYDRAGSSVMATHVCTEMDTDESFRIKVEFFKTDFYKLRYWAKHFPMSIKWNTKCLGVKLKNALNMLTRNPQPATRNPQPG